MSKFGIALRGLGLLGKKAKTISSVKSGKAVSSPLIKKLKESTTKVKGYDPKNPVHKEKMNKLRGDTGKNIHKIEKKHGRVKFRDGGRTDLLEELGRVEGEHSNRNRRAEIRRVHSELNKGYKDGGRTNLLEELGRVEAEKSNRNRRAEIARVHSELNKGYKTGGKVVKTITSPLTHLRNWRSAQAFKKANKKRTKKAEGGRIAAKDGKWIQKATASIKRRGTKGVCTGKKFGGPTCRPGTKRYNLAKTFKKMARKG